MSRTKHAADEAPVPVDQFATTARLAIPVAGLLASDPDLREAELTPSEWQARLDKYLKSETA